MKTPPMRALTRIQTRFQQKAIGFAPVITALVLLIIGLSTDQCYAGGTVTAQIYSCPSSVGPGERVNVQVRIMFSGDDNDGPWQVTNLDLRDDDTWPFYQTIQARSNPFMIYQQSVWYYYTFTDVDLSAYNDGGDGIELYVWAEVDDNDWNGYNPDGSSSIYQVKVCTVSTPSTPTGPSSGIVGNSLSFSTGGSTCAAGHAVEYRFDWGDGNISAWGSSSQSQAYRSAGTYSVKAQARCATRTAVISSWSSAKSVSISAHTVSKPSTPTGPSSGFAGGSLSYSTGGASCTAGHSLQYRFDWGDGTTSSWGSASRSKTYSTAGTYSIKAQARCATDTSVESVWSDAKTVTISWASLSGKISNRLTGLDLTGATVSISGPTNRSTSTDSAGNYSITGIPNGSYDLRIQKTGYSDTTFLGETVNGNTTINKGIDPTVTITSFSVSPASVTPGGRMTVTYNLQNSGTSQTVWLGASAQQSGATTWLDDPANDKSVTVPAGSSTHTRYFDTTTGYPLASYNMLVAIWQNKVGADMVERYHERQQANAFSVVTPPVPKLVSVTGVPATATIGQAFTVTVTARNNGAQTTEGAIHAAVRYADGSVDSLDVSAISGASWADVLIRFAPGEGAGKIYNKGQCTPRSQAAQHFLLEAVDTPWPANTERSMSFTVTPRKAGKVQVLVRTTMYAGPNCSDWLNDISADTSRPTALDEQGWDCRVYEAQAVGSAAKITSFAVPTAQLQPGTRQQVTVTFQNTGSDARKFWVGLSFKAPNATYEGWPDGWLDVPPVQVPRAVDPNLAPGGTASATFEFVLPDWMPDGPYEAVTAIWNSFDETATQFTNTVNGKVYNVAGLMVPPEFARTNRAAFTIQPPSQTDRYGLAGNDPGGLYAFIPQRHRSANLLELPLNKSAILRDANQNPLSPSTPNVIVLFHGWRSRNPYQDGDWLTLKNRLLEPGRLPADWRLVPYAWGEDSETGFWLWRDRDATSGAKLVRPATEVKSATIVMSKDGQTAESAGIVTVVLAVTYVAIEYAEQNIAANSTVAAYRAYMHGLVLGERLCSNVGSGNLKKVQIVAHSAGCWGAYAAMRYIRQNAPLAEVQVTYLDPFIPAEILSKVQQSAAFLGIWEASSKFNSATLEATKNYAKVNAAGCFSADCYWSMNDETYWGAALLANVQDIIGKCLSPVLKPIEDAVSPKLQDSTKVSWTWSSSSEIAWRTDPISDPSSYNGHSGPIRYYADSVIDPGGARFAGKAWQKSLAANGFTRIIRLEGNLAFGEVPVNTSAQRMLTIYNDGNSPLTVTSISHPNAVFTGNWSGDIPASGSRNVTVTFTPTAAQSYSGNLTVNANHTSGANTCAISGTGVVPPTITTTCPLPAGTVGVTYSQTLSATGGKTPYSWTISSGGLPPGLSLNSGSGVISGTPTAAGTYNFTIRCIGANSLYSEKPCSITANAPPTITTHPQSQTVAIGANATFSVIASGTEPLSYQWRFNGTNLPSATASTWTRINAQATHSGSYSVVVSNVAGSVTSTVATLTVIPPFPADTNLDLRISGSEQSAYNMMWMLSKIWPAPPNPIPVSYHCRCTYLFLLGGEYRFDTNLAPPLCWYPIGYSNVVSCGVATRSLPPYYTQLQPVQVKISITGDTNALVRGIEEMPPAGWIVTNVSGGFWDSASGKLKSTGRELSYVAIPPAGESGSKVFAGVASFDGKDVVIGGATAIQPAPPAIGLTLLIGKLTNGCMRLELHGLTGRGNVIIYASTNLITWAPVFTNAPVVGTLEWMDCMQSGHPKCFYGAVEMTGTGAPPPFVLPPVVKLGSPRMVNNGAVQFSVACKPGWIYLIQASTNLVNWQSIYMTTPTASSFSFADTNVANFKCRFYRTLAFPSVSSSPHPADLNADYRITSWEVLAYDACRGLGCLWPVPPNPIPSSYVTNAEYIRMSGGSYNCDPNLPPPDCWVPGP